MHTIGICVRFSDNYTAFKFFQKPERNLYECTVTSRCLKFRQLQTGFLRAWVLVRYKTRTSTIIFTAFSVAILVPFQCVMLPLLSLMGKLHLISMPGLMLVNLGFGSSMSIILFHGFIKNVPAELEEAAAIDGAGQIRVFFTIVMPLIMSLWNDYLLPSLTINKKGLQTLPLKTFLFFGAYTKKWNLGSAALVMAIVPVVIFYVCCQKYIVKGVTEGAVKG